MSQTKNDNKKEDLEVINRPYEVGTDVSSKKLDEDKNSDIYIVYVNGKPECYLKSEEDAIDTMKIIATDIKWKYANYNTLIVHKNKFEIEVIGKYRFFVVGYDQLFSRISFEKVRKFISSNKVTAINSCKKSD
jgi:hypothetical protein